jgi:hypothetical protein
MEQPLNRKETKNILWKIDKVPKEQDYYPDYNVFEEEQLRNSK